jgi:two-component system, chemotaxis family, response regulator Rcp1
MQSTRTVLLVDDNPADVDLVQEVLAKKRCQAVVARDGVEATEFLRSKGSWAHSSPPDLILLDLSLPRKNGHAVLADIKADARLRSIPVVVFSTSQAQHDVSGSYDLGANSYISKPGTLHEFVAAVNSIGDFWLGCACLPPRRSSE